MKKTNIRSRIISLRSVIPAALRVLAADHVVGGLFRCAQWSRRPCGAVQFPPSRI